MNETNNNSTNTPANVEPNPRNDELREAEATAFNSPVRIHVHSIRNRLTDADGISAKAAIDGLVHAGILEDDSPAFVKEVTYSQEKTKGEERTIITISDE